MERRRILVTGAGGFLGSWLSERLETEGYVVTRVSLTLTDALRSIKGPLIIADLCTADLREIVAGQDCVFHLAATATLRESIADPEATMRNNAEATRRLLEAIEATAKREQKVHFVLASSERVYGNVEIETVDEESPVHPAEVYAESKLRAERYCQEFSQRGSITYTIVRAANVFGPRQNREMFIPACILRILAAHRTGATHILVGNTSHYRNFIFVEDFIDAFLAILRNPASHNQIFNIGGENRQVQEVLAMLEQIAKEQLEFSFDIRQNADLERSSNIELPRH
ncbi:MAG TPA: NAD-dependent epimerase/dehydratase family protein, partial [Candidatus Nanoarchaeia archaeon]|nr:NAD-dependent epimerase/dehydratase family protein [Candidatus Nanoarchaeia archaeon]